MNRTFLRLGVSSFFLATLAYGAVLHARDHAPAKPVQAKVTFAVEKIAPEDLDIVGVVGDVFVNGCTRGDARCNKAWQDLGQLAGKPSL